VEQALDKGPSTGPSIGNEIRLERLTNHCKQFRRIATRYEKRAANDHAIWLIAATLLWLGFAITP
jgi:hypothetical protein